MNTLLGIVIQYLKVISEYSVINNLEIIFDERSTFMYNGDIKILKFGIFKFDMFLVGQNGVSIVHIIYII